MEMKEQTSRFFHNEKTFKLSGTPNGCCAVIKTTGTCELYTAEGKKAVTVSDALDGMLLNDGFYFIEHMPSKDSPLNMSALINLPVWSLFDKAGSLVMTDITECEVYANGWYRIVKNNYQTLYRDDHSEVAKDFTQCVVFFGGYGLRCNEKFYRYADWRLFNAKGEFLRPTCNTIALLGNGLVLQHNEPFEKGCKLYNPTNGEVIEKDILDYQTFPNGRFVLTIQKPSCCNTFDPASCQRLSYIYEPDGTRISTGTKDATFLPDGRFCQAYTGRLFALYHANGLLVTDEVWSIEVAGNYYLTEYEGITTLFNNQGENLGEGFELIRFQDNFTLVADKKDYHLFNQYGEVLTFPEE